MAFTPNGRKGRRDMDKRMDEIEGYEAPRLDDLGSVEDLTLDPPGIGLSIIIP